MELCLWWLQCQECQHQFRYYWDKGSHNWADYHTEHHRPIYHESNTPTYAGAACLLSPQSTAPFRNRWGFLPSSPLAYCFFSFFRSEHNLGCHCKGVLFIYYLHMVGISTKLIISLLLTLLLEICLLCYSSVSRCTYLWYTAWAINDDLSIWPAPCHQFCAHHHVWATRVACVCSCAAQHMHST